MHTVEVRTAEPAMAAATAPPRRPRWHRCLGSPWLHGGFALAASSALWLGLWLDVLVWACGVLAFSVAAPTLALAAAVAIGIDRRLELSRRTHGIVGWSHAIFAVQLAWHWYHLLHTPLHWC